MKRKWNWPIWVGFVVVVAGLFSYGFFVRFPIDAGFSMGESFAFWNWGCVVDSWLVPRVRPAAGLSRKDFRLDLHSDCCACCRVFQLRNLLRRATGAGLKLARRALGKRRLTFILLDQNGKPVGLGDLLSDSKGCRADFLSRFLVTAMQLRVAEFSAKAAGVRGTWHSRCRHQRRSAGY